ncbi:2-methylisocitrate lyase-like PEP mutase family enzyme [Amycolatopsis bartoniae]|uniref:Carboxyvinyl-carboxyphosphonate phosphorylmutase n=1 Tax=Amycolatopsis bartoniae TaxID=941986 RepID=A0A8H9IYP7_9PSEU|nr:isocitrate lyase/phosphoenolpyruvate mutase family protein [Amycolatopsis bartoniae]MBB2934366.1 2-methylisocitrate lyase-like PEP mutase family enzyme [Amycolatopsis bartoniae]TVS99944.1 isocitrate lyase/phosphoenolpyruvate mutase family protein [Amycolatopsis bartoniae]GHF47867.1 carboxyvinyl-carboxyphosphonate phosphorylmutase [Amycolatopsis bartoniae]
MTAATLRALHVPGHPLLLPNVWDAATARLVEEAGFPVVATSSLAVAASLGYADGEQAPAGEMFQAAARIARAVSVPVTVDAEAGYGLPPAELVERLLETGAVGCNLEDTDHTTKRLRPVAEHAEWLAAVREAAGDALVINARVDLFLKGEPRQVLPEAIERAKAYLAAGADCVYPILLRDADVLEEFVRAVSPGAVNGNRIPDTDLAAMGIARISLGARLWQDMREWFAGRLKEL